VGSSAGLDAVRRKSCHFPCRELNPGRPAGNIVCLPTELSQLYSLNRYYINVFYAFRITSQHNQKEYEYQISTIQSLLHY
jgi:hypothetical protein